MSLLASTLHMSRCVGPGWCFIFSFVSRFVSREYGLWNIRLFCLWSDSILSMCVSCFVDFLYFLFFSHSIIVKAYVSVLSWTSFISNMSIYCCVWFGVVWSKHVSAGSHSLTDIFVHVCTNSIHALSWYCSYNHFCNWFVFALHYAS